jgi:hypothetical protein
MPMKTIAYLGILVLIFSCGSNKTYTEQDNQAFQNLQEMVRSKHFEIISNYARPMTSTAFMKVANSNILGPGNTGNNIDITGNANNLTIKGDSIQGLFPYFGELQLGSGFPGGTHQGIEFKDLPDDYKIDIIEKKRNVTIRFNIDDQYRNNERYNVFITIFPNKRSTIQINSTNRTSIEYTGTARLLKEDTMVEN